MVKTARNSNSPNTGRYSATALAGSGAEVIFRTSGSTLSGQARAVEHGFYVWGANSNFLDGIATIAKVC